MPFQIIRNDITKMHVDAIVNTANPRPVIGRGTDSAIYAAAGAERLLAERQKIGEIRRGDAAATPAFGLNAEYIIHTVGPVWEGGSRGEEEILRNCYRNSLALAEKHACRSIAFPLISAGVYGFPREQALQIALAEFSRFLMDPAREQEMEIYLVVFDRRSFGLSEKLFPGLQSYIDDHYAAEKHRAEHGSDLTSGRSLRYDRRRRDEEWMETCQDVGFLREESTVYGFEAAQAAEPVMPKKPRSLKDVVGQVGETFQERLFRLIDARGMSNSSVYKGANLTKQLFSKINSNKNYQPKKNTVLALAISLRLNLDETRDLLSRAGFALSPSSISDQVVSYFLETGSYRDILDIEYALDSFGQAPLGSYE